MNYFDYETINQKGLNGEPATPISFAYGNGNKHFEYIIDPKINGIDNYIDHSLPGGWAREYQDAYKVHGLNVDEIIKPTNNRKVIRNKSQLNKMYKDFFNSSNGEIAGFFNKGFDDLIMREGIKDSEELIKQYNSLKVFDIRDIAYEVLGKSGESKKDWFLNHVKNTNSRTTNESLARIFNVDLSNISLHQATDDIKVTEELHNRLKKFDIYKQKIKSAKNKQEWFSEIIKLKKDFGNNIISLPIFDELLESGITLGVDENKFKNKIKSARNNNFINGVNEDVKKYFTTEERYNYNKSAIDKKLKSRYTDVEKNNNNSILKSLYSKIDKLSDNIHSVTGLNKSKQSKILAGAGILLAGNLLLNRQSDEEEEKLNKVNQQINADKGDYIKY